MGVKWVWAWGEHICTISHLSSASYSDYALPQKTQKLCKPLQFIFRPKSDGEFILATAITTARIVDFNVCFPFGNADLEMMDEVKREAAHRKIELHTMPRKLIPLPKPSETYELDANSCSLLIVSAIMFFASSISSRSACLCAAAAIIRASLIAFF